MNGHLIHIGFPKSGSTFLQEWFRQHPKLIYAPGGIGGFHDIYGISHLAAQNANSDIKYFVTSDESLSTPRPSTGTIPIKDNENIRSLKPVQLAQKNACKILNSLFPNSKILFITRGFKGMIMSGYSQIVRTGGTMNFQELTGLSLSSMQQKENEEDGGGMDFTFITNLYEEAFGKENMIILPFEMLRDNQNKFLSIIEEQLGITHFDCKIGRVNESLTPQELYWYPRISSIISKVSRRIGLNKHEKIYRWYVNKIFHNKLRPLIKILSHLKPGCTVKDQDLPIEMLDFYRRNNSVRCAARFRHEPLYAPYLSEYLLDT